MLKRNHSILLVEDNSDDVYFISRALRDGGLQLTLEVVQDGQAAVDFLLRAADPTAQTTTPCLMILDLNLPHKPGLELLQWTRFESSWKNIVVIVLTSSTCESDIDQAYRLGANSYVVKPSDATKLREFVHFMKGYWFGWNQAPISAPAT